MKFGPSVYSVKMSPARSSISSCFIQSPRYFSRPSCLGVSLRSNGRFLACSSRMRASIFSRSSGVNFVVALEIVIEAGFGRRSDAELGFREELQHRRRQQMRGRVPVDL